ncbi:endonuclease domain-containing protein [Paenarthrobacter sp. 2TAF44]|uniref:endonuclease domain-containing protein n=1 Tax=Paenarthrobacter sp. 2TAF44 TaxID=3233018 RepID=UPI003F985100
MAIPELRIAINCQLGEPRERQPVDKPTERLVNQPEWGMRRASLPDHLTTGSFSVRASDKAGVPRSRTHAKDLVLVSRGIRVPAGSDASGASALHAYTDLDDSSILVSLSAARIWGVPLPSSYSGDWRIHLARRRGFSFPRRVNVVGHLLTFQPDEVGEHDGVRLTSPARTWLDLAATLTVEDLVAAGDSLVCSHGADFPVPKEAVCSIEELRNVVDRHPGMRGVRTARAALDLLRGGADSAPESLMRLALLNANLPEPQLNHVVRNNLGHAVLWPDAAYLEYRISLQYDGQHHGSAEQHLRDIERQEKSLALGWLEVRISKHDLQGEWPAVVHKVRRALQSRGWEPRRGDS